VSYEGLGIKPLAVTCCGSRSSIATATPSKEKPPPFPVRVVQDKAPGGDLLRVAIFDRNSNAKQRKTPTVSGEGCSG
jgi:hypothetical protein